MEKHVTFGIAGHVDHGKTSLVRLLTGIDTDRLKEEKRRGLSIESGIAPMLASPDLTISLVDVPGHTDFLKNTIRGLSCVDAAALVIAADDGVMPQTKEHLEILSFFGTKKGFVVLSKADLVDEETLELARFEIEDLVRDTFLEQSKTITFSAVDGRGLDEVREEIINTATIVPGKSLDAPFRLWIDQVKGFPGFGTVVSGTVLSGRLSENDAVAVLPAGIETRARSLQVHHKKVEGITAGQRAGINLHKISEREVTRGMLIAEPGTQEIARLLNVRLHVPSRVAQGLKDHQKIRLHIGTAVVNATLILMERNFLGQGEGGFAQMRLSHDLSACPGDTFLISPLNVQTLIGGGSILELTKEKFRMAKAARMIPYLNAVWRRDSDSFIELLIRLERNDLLDPVQITKTTGFGTDEIKSSLERKIGSGELISFGDAGSFPSERFNVLKEKLPTILAEILQENPLKQSASSEEIKARLAPSLDDIPFKVMLSRLVEGGEVVKKEGGFRLPNFSASLSGERQSLVDMLLAYAEESGFVPFSADTFWKLHRRQHNKNELQRLLDYLHNQGRLIRLNNRRYMTPRAMEEIKKKTCNLIKGKGSIGIGDCKEIMGYGRTVGVPVLEYLDSIGFTRRDGDKRTLA
ncbi:MAG: selenocysteine-specific translation elongation factor [Deltaproteobacteria bacterium CG23_combo_of_CG06-09_8_20_14_all_51_20]|nr:MAG: selenocysteine-specific translation elongation factor [Deltaproteobacteria bacterium CG23_combo_of_CG06-09_8_20_14_all_51_20]